MVREIITIGNRTFEIPAGLHAFEKEQIIQKIQGTSNTHKAGCSSCRGKHSPTPTPSQYPFGDMMSVGTAACGGPYTQNSTHVLTGQVTPGTGTGPFTYTWTITPPTGTGQVLVGPVQYYTFTQAGTYIVRCDVLDSCPSGSKTDSATCSVVITAGCYAPQCSIIIT